MVLSAEDYSMRAAFYAKAADDEVAPRELRLVFARKANWFHILARLEEEKRVWPKDSNASQQSSVGRGGPGNRKRIGSSSFFAETNGSETA